MGSNPSHFYGVRTDWPAGTYTNLDRPVDTVSWNNAMDYCQQLTLREQAAGGIPTNYIYNLPAAMAQPTYPALSSKWTGE